jgi:hypothetical protein
MGRLRASCAPRLAILVACVMSLFLVAALKDPIGDNLDRTRIIKAWLGGNGELHEQTYHPARSDAVNLEDAAWTNPNGDPEFFAVWEAPAGHAHEFSGARLYLADLV